jgi:hypothetical protein
MRWEKTLPTKPRGKATIHRSKDVTWQHCTKTKFSFLARELVRVDPAAGRREYYCQICHKAEMGRRSWHYWPKGQRPLGYVEQGVLTAIDAVSEERARIGLNPPSISDVQNYAGGWWPESPFVGGTGHFVLDGFSYSSVRDAVNGLAKRGMICIIEDQLTHEKRILGGSYRPRPGELLARTWSAPWADPGELPQLFHDVHYEFESWKPQLHFEPLLLPAAAINWWDSNTPAPGIVVDVWRGFGSEYWLYDGTLIEAVDLMAELRSWGYFTAEPLTAIIILTEFYAPRVRPIIYPPQRSPLWDWFNGLIELFTRGLSLWVRGNSDV